MDQFIGVPFPTYHCQNSTSKGMKDVLVSSQTWNKVDAFQLRVSVDQGLVTLIHLKIS